MRRTNSKFYLVRGCSLLGFLCGDTSPWLLSAKQGPRSSPASYRFLATGELHGLVQEQLLMARISGMLHKAVEWYQTGYRYDVRNHHFTFSFLLQEYSSWNRCFVAIFADFVHAFPRCWRSALLHECYRTAGLRDGALALLGHHGRLETFADAT